MAQIAGLFPLSLLAVACSSAGAGDAASTESAAVASSPVQLVWAGGNQGIAVVDDIGQNQEVTFHYRWNGGPWTDAHAVRDGESGGRTYFSAHLPDARPDPQESGNNEVEFAIRYRADGREYWDNNGGKDYLIRQHSNYVACIVHTGFTADDNRPDCDHRPGGGCWKSAPGFCKDASKQDEGQLVVTGPGFTGDVLLTSYSASGVGGTNSGSAPWNQVSFEAIVRDLPGLTAVEIVGDHQTHVIPFKRTGLKNGGAEIWAGSWRSETTDDRLENFHVNLKFGSRVQKYDHGGRDFTCTWRGNSDVTCDPPAAHER